jgi:hypothetical protein
MGGFRYRAASTHKPGAWAPGVCPLSRAACGGGRCARGPGQPALFSGGHQWFADQPNAAMESSQGKPLENQFTEMKAPREEPARFDCSRLLALLQESLDGFTASPSELLVILFKNQGVGQPQLTSLRLSCGINVAPYSSTLDDFRRGPHATANAQPFVTSL